MNSNLTPTPIIDKNGKPTTVHKNLDKSRGADKRALSVGKPALGVEAKLEGEGLTVPFRYNPNLAGAGVRVKDGGVVVGDLDAVLARFFRTTKGELPVDLADFASNIGCHNAAQYVSHADMDGEPVDSIYFTPQTADMLRDYAYQYSGVSDGIGMLDFVRSQGHPTEGCDPVEAVTSLIAERASLAEQEYIADEVVNYANADIRSLREDALVIDKANEMWIDVPEATDADDISHGIWGVAVRQPGVDPLEANYILVAGFENFAKHKKFSILLVD